MRRAFRAWLLGAALAAPASAATPATTSHQLPPGIDRPVAGYAAFLMRAPATGERVNDIALCRNSDHATQIFTFTRSGQRDAKAIAAFLRDTHGRVSKVFDQFGGHDLTPGPSSPGPLADARMVTDGLPGLLFDNDGAFEGNPPAYGRSYYAVNLHAAGFSMGGVRGVTIVAGLRVGNVTSIAPATLWTLGPGTASQFSLLAGYKGGLSAGDDRTSVIYGGLFPAGPALPSTPSVLSVAMDTHGTTLTAAGFSTTTTRALPAANWTDLELGTTTKGGGAGWQLDSYLLFDRALPAGEIARIRDVLASSGATASRPVVVLDGSSVEAGVGSTALRNFTRLYESRLPDATIYNVAVGGATTAQRLAALPGTLAVFPPGNETKILVNAVGANSLARGVTAIETYADITRYVAEAHAALPGVKIGLTTIIPMNLGIVVGHEAAFVAYNAMVRENRAGADFIIDRNADPVMGSEATVFPHIDRRYSTDGVHPTDRGYEALAAIDAKAIANVLRGAAASPGK